MNTGVAILLASMLVLSPGWLSDDEIEQAFAGRTIEGAYATGLPFIETYEADGRVDYREPNRRLTGRWSTVAGSFCTIYDDGISGGCFRVRQFGANCYEFYVSALTEEEAAEAPEPIGWTARGWRVGEPNTCEPAPAA